MEAMHPPPQLEKSWVDTLQAEWNQPYLTQLRDFLEKERAEAEVYPPQKEVFQALNATSFQQVKVVIVGQDPYHGPGQAHGLSFSVKEGVTPPPSLKNIFKELEGDLGLSLPSHGSLLKWANQGVLLLNHVLTVRARTPRSHYGKGWERFTDAIIAKLAEREEPLVFVLWGRGAREKCAHVGSPHVVLTSPHPSPYSAHTGFFGCRHFSKINEHLTRWGKPPIDWSLS